MSIVERYVLRLSTLSFIAALAGLTGVIWVTQALRDFDLLTTKGQTLLIFLAVTSLSIPSLVMVIAPVALLIAILFVLNKLNGDSELAVINSVGISPARLMRPFAVLTLVTAALVAAMSLWAMPSSFSTVRDLLTKVRADFLTHVAREGQFVNLDHGLIFHYRERLPGAGLKGIFIQDRRNPDQISTYIAETGITVANDDQNFLVLEKGSIQRQGKESRDPVMVVFDRYAIDLAQFGADGQAAPLRPRERSTEQLLRPNLADPFVQANRNALRAELHDRLVSPLYAIAFGMIGFAALGRARTTRQGRGAAIMGAIVAAVGTRLVGFGVTAVSARHPAALVFLYVPPLLSTFFAAWYIFGDPAGWLRRLWQPRPVATAPAAG
jgi:lipopolysaccharide export system permease protein